MSNKSSYYLKKNPTFTINPGNCKSSYWSSASPQEDRQAPAQVHRSLNSHAKRGARQLTIQNQVFSSNRRAKYEISSHILPGEKTLDTNQKVRVRVSVRVITIHEMTTMMMKSVEFKSTVP